MKISHAAAMTTVTLAVAACPALAAAHCGCPVAHHRHHRPHRAVTRAAYYAPAPIAGSPYEVGYEQTPPPVDVIYGQPPAYWTGPAWYGAGVYYGGYGGPGYYGGAWRGGGGRAWRGGFVGHGGHFRR